MQILKQLLLKKNRMSGFVKERIKSEREEGGEKESPRDTVIAGL